MGIAVKSDIPMKFHHKPGSVEDPAMQKLAQVCYLAGRCADVFVEESAATAVAELHEFCQSQYKLPEADCDAMLNQISKRTAEIAPLFDINVNTGLSHEAILRRAAGRHSTDPPTASSRREVENDELRQKASADALTGLASRGKFDSFLPALVNKAVKEGTAVALLLLDMDHFKSINDRHGHQKGDMALQSVAKVLSTLARPCDLAARYGGEEMAVVVQ